MWRKRSIIWNPVVEYFHPCLYFVLVYFWKPSLQKNKEKAPGIFSKALYLCLSKWSFKETYMFSWNKVLKKFKESCQTSSTIWRKIYFNCYKEHNSFKSTTRGKTYSTHCSIFLWNWISSFMWTRYASPNPLVSRPSHALGLRIR